MRPWQPEAAWTAAMIAADRPEPSGESTRRSGDEVFGNRDFLGDRFDAMDWRATASAGEAHRFAVDQQGPAPDAVRFAAFERTGEAVGLQGAGATDRLGPSDLEVVVGEEEMGERAGPIRASSPADERRERRLAEFDLEGVALGLRFDEHGSEGTDGALTGRCSKGPARYSSTAEALPMCAFRSPSPHRR